MIRHLPGGGGLHARAPVSDVEPSAEIVRTVKGAPIINPALKFIQYKWLETAILAVAESVNQRALLIVLNTSRHGNIHDQVAAEDVTQLLKTERIKQKFYMDRVQARSDVLDHIELFYNSHQCSGFTNQLAPVEFEPLKNGSVQKNRGQFSAP